jgi:hypothetical protein
MFRPNTLKLGPDALCQRCRQDILAIKYKREKIVNPIFSRFNTSIKSASKRPYGALKNMVFQSFTAETAEFAEKILENSAFSRVLCGENHKAGW